MLSQAPVSSALKTLPVSTVVDQSPDTSAADQFVDLLQQLVSGQGTTLNTNKPQLTIDTNPAEIVAAKTPDPAPVDDKKTEEDDDAQKEVAAKSDADDQAQAAAANAQNQNAAAVPSEAIATSAPVEQPQPATTDEKAPVAQQASQQQTPVQQTAAVTTTQVQTAATVAVQQNLDISSKQVAAAQTAAAPQEQTAVAQQVSDMAQQAVETPKIQAQTAVQTEAAKAEIPAVPLAESDKLLVPTGPQLSEMPKVAPTPVIASATVASAQLAGANLAASATIQRQDLSQSLQLGRASVLSKALDEIASDRSPLPSALLLGDKAKASTAKETTGKSGAPSQQEKIILQIQKIMDQAAQQRDGSSITVKIEPEELGQVTVRVTQRGDQLFARVIPENKEVESTVRSNVTNLVAHLVTAGFKADNIHISVGRENSGTSMYAGKQGANTGTSPGTGQGAQGQASQGERHGSSNVFGSKGDGGLQPGLDAAGENQVVDSGWVA